MGNVDRTDLSLKVFKFVVVLTCHLLRVHASLLRRGIVVVKVACVGRVSQFGDDGAFDFSVVERVPIDGGEEGVRFHAVYPPGEIA